MEQLLHRTVNESTYYAQPLPISLLRTTANCYFSGQIFWPKVELRSRAGVAMNEMLRNS